MVNDKLIKIIGQGKIVSHFKGWTVSGRAPVNFIARPVGGVSSKLNPFTVEMGYPASFQLPVNGRAVKAKQISN